jgi:hypothetical protein
MHSRRLVLGSAAALVCIATVAATVNLRQINSRNATVPAPGKSRLYAYGGRTPQQRAAAPARMDAALAGIAAHALTGASAASLADLRNFNPAARFRPASVGGAPEVAIDAATHGDAQQLKSALVALGLEHPAVFANSVGGFLPVSALNAAAASPEVAYIHASMPHRRGVVATQGDYAQHSYAVRQAYTSLTGSGVTVGVISDSFDCYAVYAAAGTVPASGNDGYASNGFTATAEDDEASGALPAASAINVLAEPYTASGPATPTGNCLDYGSPTQLPFSDEGRAMMQIVHAVAPGANLAFYTGDNSEADFATAITTLASPVSSGGAGAKVIADDLGYYDEPYYQDGIVAQAIDTVEAQGVAYFSAAGNNGNASWESTSPSFPVRQSSGAANNAGEYLLNFDTTNATTATALPITLSPLVPGEYVAIVVEWDQPYVTGAPNSGGATNQIDICVTGASTGVVVQDYDGNNVTCTGLNRTGVDPVQVLIVGNSAAATGNTPTQNLDLYVGTNNQSTAPHRLIVSVETDGQTSPAPIASFSTNSETIQGHPNAAGAAAVAAAFYFQTPQCGTTPTELEAYSSQGGAPILFSSTGQRLATPQLRQKPNFVGPDGVNDTFLGFTLANGGVTNGTGLLPDASAQCQNDPSYPNFFGTSAATPHAAGIAALMLQAQPAITPTQIYSALENSALAVGAVPTSTTFNFTAGYGFIQADAALATPILGLSNDSIAVGATTTLSWSTIEASSCTASGAWTGPEASSGSLSITPTAAGIDTYTLTCTNATGATGTSSVVLNVGSPPAAPALALSSTTVAEGGSTTLTWSSSFATSCTASGNGWSGTEPTSGSEQFTASSLTTQTFILVCSNAFGNSPSSTVSFTVTPPPPAAPTLSLSATSIVIGGSATLTWSDSGATSCTASGSWSGSQASSGTVTETPTAAGSYPYTLVCANANGNSAATTVTLDVTAPTPTATLTASASSIVVGSTATLTWVSTNATGCTASGSWSGTLATSGSQTVTPTAAGSDTYTLICSNGTVNSSASSVTLTVSAKSSGGGGGALDGASLLVLGGIAVAARREARRRRARL